MLINTFALDTVPLDGSGGSTPPPPPSGMTIQVVDCRNLVVTLTVDYDHFRVLNPSNWGLSPAGFVNRVQYIDGDSYAVNTTRTFAGVVYTLTADV